MIVLPPDGKHTHNSTVLQAGSEDKLLACKDGSVHSCKKFDEEEEKIIC